MKKYLLNFFNQPFDKPLRSGIIFFYFVLNQFCFAQSPQGIPYQAVLRNADGSLMSSTAVSLTIMIHDVTATGAVVYEESHALTSNAQGLVTCVMGNGVVSQGNFSSINWGNGAKFMHVMLGSTDLGTQQMMSVPYALHSTSSENSVNSSFADNGFSNVSLTGDTLFMLNGAFLIVPGISSANHPTLVSGCTNDEACNYNSSASQDDGSCLIQGTSCNDENSNTTNDYINIDCSCEGTPISNSGIGNQLMPGNATCSLQFISVTGCQGQTAITYDGRTYSIEEIEGQCWFAENLATDQYLNGDPILSGLSVNEWQNTSNGAYALSTTSSINSAQYNSIYGKLYNWYAVSDIRGLCPAGWHVPSDCEWMYLEMRLGMSNEQQELINAWRGTVEGGSLKSTLYWLSPNAGATNSTNFSALPGGMRSSDGSFGSLGSAGFWWSSTQTSSDYARYRNLDSGFSKISRQTALKQLGINVRCIKD